MGLAAPKNRTKISNDPQNTTWANNTSRFGHRILTSQGWEPGSSLGASDAAHAAHYTAASQSHIRVFLKDDNLGLGAKRGSEKAENFGLAGLESILGRLNGNEAEVKKEEERREKIEQRAYVYKKYGFMNFVSGGFLVGDKIKTREEVKSEPEVKVEIKSEPESDEDSNKKKRKRADREEEAVDEQDEENPKLKRKKKSMDLREEARNQEANEAKSSKKSKKEKKDKKKSKKEKKSTTSDPEPMTEDAPSPASDPEPLTDKARRKAEKKARKEERKLKRALKRAAKESAKTEGDAEDSSSESEADSTPATSTPATGTSTPTVSAAGLTFSARGMHAVRQKWIRSKKSATMDSQALKEIFMIKTPS